MSEEVMKKCQIGCHNLYDANNLLAECYGTIGRLMADGRRLDWLADKGNNIGNVTLPTMCVENNIRSLRDAIDEAMEGA